MKSGATSIGALKDELPRIDKACPKLHLLRLAELGHLSRCFDTEVLDDPLLSEDAVAQAYRELHRTHWWLGNTAAVLHLLRQDPLPIRSVLDIGCGHGALLLEIRRRLGAEVVGFDLRKPSAVAPVPIITGNAVTEPLPRADVAIAVYMAHHLSGDDLIRLIRNVSCSCRRFIVLDLVRHRLPLALFRGFVCPFLGSLNAKDGAISIRRSYTPQEMRCIVNTALDGSEWRGPAYCGSVLHPTSGGHFMVSRSSRFRTPLAIRRSFARAAELLDLAGAARRETYSAAREPAMASNFSGIICLRWREEMKTLRIVFAGLLVIAAASLQAAAQTTPNEIKVTAKKYEFNPSTIKVKQGDHVRLVITALDHDHGFKLEAFNIDHLLKKGEAVTIEFTADKAGTFPFECSHFCGLGHKRMKGELVVE